MLMPDAVRRALCSAQSATRYFDIAAAAAMLDVYCHAAIDTPLIAIILMFLLEFLHADADAPR